MSQLSQIIPYDSEQYIDNLIMYLKENLPNDYQDFLTSDAARVLIDGIGHEMGLLAYALNANMKQWFLSTATTKKAVYLLGKLADYKLRGKIASSVTLTFSIDEVHSCDIIIPAGTQVSTKASNPIVFETTDDVTIDAGDLSVDASATQSITVSEVVGTTDGSKAQSFKTSYPMLLDTLEVKVVDQVVITGVVWEEFEFYYLMSRTDRGYTIDLDENDYATIQFGDGIFGIVPPEDCDIQFSYSTGGGSAGNVGVSKISEIISDIPDVEGESVALSVTNAESATGGTDSESVDEAKTNIAASLRAMNRLVTEEDFVNIPKSFSGEAGAVYKSAAAVSYTWAEHLITVYILAEGAEGVPALPSEALKEELLDWLSGMTLATINLSIDDGVITYFDIVATVYYSSGFHNNVVQVNVEAAISDLMNYASRAMGGDVYLADLYSAIDSAEGVDHVDITTPSSNIAAAVNEYLVLQDITITYTGVS